jgi:hypothetical protein
MNRIAGWFFAAAALLAAGVFPAQAEVLVPTGATWSYFKGRTAPSSPDPTAWRTPQFADNSWASGAASF